MASFHREGWTVIVVGWWQVGLGLGVYTRFSGRLRVIGQAARG